MKYASFMFGLIFANRAFAHHELTPLREAVVQGHSHDVGGATFWLVGAVVAMVAALYLVHWSIFRKP